MAKPTNPKRRNPPVAETPEDSAVTDIDTTEAPEAEATADAAPATPAEPKVVIDHEGNLFTAITNFAKDGDVAKLQASYREVPAAARGKVQGVAMKRAMVEGGLDIEVIGTVLDAFNNLPVASKTSRTKTELDPTTVGAVRLFGLMSAYEALRKELGDDAHNLAERWFNAEVPAEHKPLTDKIAESVAKGSAARGGGGPRNVLKQSFAELVTSGAIPAGSTLKGANGAEAEVTSDGKIVTKGATFDAPTPAAKAWRVQADGKTQTSTNGWDFWTLDGKSIGSLRTH